MRLLIIHEGVHEGVDHEADPQGNPSAVQTMVCRLTMRDFCQIEHLPITRIPRKLQGTNRLKKALSCLIHAREESFDAVVVLIDEDGDFERSRAFEQAQNHPMTGVVIHRAFGVAIRSFDAWMLADQQAMTKALGGPPIDQTKAPEQLRDPKGVARKIVDGRMSLREFYRKVAEHADIQRLAERCPKGFAPFAERLRAWT